MTIKELVDKSRPGIEQLTEEMREYISKIMLTYLIYKLGQMIFYERIKNNGKHEN